MLSISIDWEAVLLWLVIQLVIFRILGMLIWLLLGFEHLIPFAIAYALGILSIYGMSWPRFVR